MGEKAVCAVKSAEGKTTKMWGENAVAPVPCEKVTRCCSTRLRPDKVSSLPCGRSWRWGPRGDSDLHTVCVICVSQHADHSLPIVEFDVMHAEENGHLLLPGDNVSEVRLGPRPPRKQFLQSPAVKGISALSI